MLETILDQPIVIKAMTPVQPIANTLTTRYLDYAMPAGRTGEDQRVSYAVVDADGNVSWEGDTQLLAQQPEQRRKNTARRFNRSPARFLFRHRHERKPDLGRRHRITPKLSAAPPQQRLIAKTPPDSLGGVFKYLSGAAFTRCEPAGLAGPGIRETLPQPACRAERWW